MVLPLLSVVVLTLWCLVYFSVLMTCFDSTSHPEVNSCMNVIPNSHGEAIRSNTCAYVSISITDMPGVCSLEASVTS